MDANNTFVSSLVIKVSPKNKENGTSQTNNASSRPFASNKLTNLSSSVNQNIVPDWHRNEEVMSKNSPSKTSIISNRNKIERESAADCVGFCADAYEVENYSSSQIVEKDYSELYGSIRRNQISETIQVEESQCESYTYESSNFQETSGKHNCIGATNLKNDYNGNKKVQKHVSFDENSLQHSSFDASTPKSECQIVCKNSMQGSKGRQISENYVHNQNFISYSDSRRHRGQEAYEVDDSDGKFASTQLCSEQICATETISQKMYSRHVADEKYQKCESMQENLVNRNSCLTDTGSAVNDQVLLKILGNSDRKLFLEEKGMPCAMPNTKSAVSEFMLGKSEMMEERLTTAQYAEHLYEEKHSKVQSNAAKNKEFELQKLELEERMLEAALNNDAHKQIPTQTITSNVDDTACYSEQSSSQETFRNHIKVANKKQNINNSDNLCYSSSGVIPPTFQNSKDFVSQKQQNVQEVSSFQENVCINTSSNDVPSTVISIFKGHVKLKSQAFQAVEHKENTSLSCNGVCEYAELTANLGGIVKDSVDALQDHSHEARHESQITGDDIVSVDGHVKVKQNLFETLPVGALYEHGITHSSQIVTRGRRKSNLEQVLTEFNTKPLSEINEREHVKPAKDEVNYDVSGMVTSFKTYDDCQRIDTKKIDLHESQRVDGDIPFDTKLVRENAERFEHENFCYKNYYCSSQSVTEEEKSASTGLCNTVKGQFESKPLDFIGMDDRPERHQSQVIDDIHTCRPRSGEPEDFVLSECHPSQQINYHEKMLNGLTHVREKRRNYYERCNSPARCMSRELLEDSEILNSPNLSGIVKNTATMLLEDSYAAKAEGRQARSIKFSNDAYVKPLKNKFETNTISQLGEKSDLHPSQRIDYVSGLSEETQRQHCESNEHLGLHTSQVIDPGEYSEIKSDVNAKTFAFMVMPLSDLALHEDGPKTENIEVESKIAQKREAFESCCMANSSTLHSSQVVGDDIHLISKNDTEDSGPERPVLHESQKVNYGIVRPTSRRLDHSQDIEAEDIENKLNFHRDIPSRASVKSVKSEVDEKDFELLLNYTPVVKQELPSMVTVMTKGVPAELIESGHPILTEYVVDDGRKRITVGSRSSTPVRKPSSTSSRPHSSAERTSSSPLTRSTLVNHFSRSSTPAGRHLQDLAQPKGVLPKDFVFEDETDLSHPLNNNSPPLPSYPSSSSPGSNSDFVEQPFPPPPAFEVEEFRDCRTNPRMKSHDFIYDTATDSFDNGVTSDCPDFVQDYLYDTATESGCDNGGASDCPDFVEALPRPTCSYPDFVIDHEAGSTVNDPSNKNNFISASDAELSFWTVDQENFLREKFSKHSSRQLTSSADSINAFLRVRDEDLNRKISAVTVDSYHESDDQWDHGY